MSQKITISQVDDLQQGLNDITKAIPRPNLQLNGGFELGTHGVTASHTSGGTTTVISSFSIFSVFGSMCLHVSGQGAGVYVIAMPVVSAVEGTRYTVTGDLVAFNIGSTGFHYFDMVFLNGAGVVIAESSNSPRVNDQNFSYGDENRNGYAVSFVAPANTQFMYARACITSPSLAPTALAIRQVKIEEGNLPATPYITSERSLQGLFDSDAFIDMGNVSGTVVLDFSKGRNFKMRAIGNITLAEPIQRKNGWSGLIEIEQDTTGSRTIAKASAIGGPAPTLSTAVNAVDVIPYYTRSDLKVVLSSVQKGVTA